MGTKVKVLEYSEEVEMIFQSSNVLNASEDHPMHLHGHSLYMIGASAGIFYSKEDPKSYVNTAPLPWDGRMTIRFRALNPGNISMKIPWGVAMALSLGDALQLGNEDCLGSEKWANS
ncbi:hypothetical protein EZV62_022390 [Acer yangbiense]|uniref:Plastocyanin-like domain-containing protein n=1 Tax=Acer yangbiense TaxID=1000413 RepID=A0A5C7H8C6_9ROSI|nr:hypothetical protein EZV62_022390 [Acer yangbiense]